MTRRVPKRPLLAAILSILQPGVGHLYLREWIRAALWGGLWITAFGIAVRNASVELAGGDLIATLFGIFGIVEQFSATSTLLLFSVTFLAAVDSYWIATSGNRKLQTETLRCHHCGREVDPSLDFCHWCTTSLEDGQGG